MLTATLIERPSPPRTLRILGLGLCKPFLIATALAGLFGILAVSDFTQPRELLARVRAVLRRSSTSVALGSTESDKLTFGEFEVDISAHRLTRGPELISLTSGEFDLLSILVKNPNKVLDRDRILDLLTGAERSPFDRSIDVRITRLRAKIEVDPANPLYIKTIWGKGYMFCPGEVG